MNGDRVIVSGGKPTVTVPASRMITQVDMTEPGTVIVLSADPIYTAGWNDAMRTAHALRWPIHPHNEWWPLRLHRWYMTSWLRDLRGWSFLRGRYVR